MNYDISQVTEKPLEQYKNIAGVSFYDGYVQLSDALLE
jgi:hypothetical protein